MVSREIFVFSKAVREQTHMKTYSAASIANNSTALPVIFCIWSFFMLCRPQDYLQFLEYLRPGLTLGFLALCAWFLSAKNREAEKPSEKQLRLYSYLILVMALSVPFSYYQGASLRELIHYSSIVLFVFLFYRQIDNAWKLTRLLYIYCIGIAVYGLSILTKGTLTEGRIFFGSMFDPNDTAFYMISFITFNLFFLYRDNKPMVRLFALCSLLLALLVIIKTGSRGGFISLMAVLTFFLFRKSVFFRISGIQKVGLILLAVAALQFAGLSQSRFSTILKYKDDYNVTSEEGRIATWKIGMRIMATHPLTGIGFNRFPEGVGRDREARGLDSAKWQTAHNSLVQIGAETGVIGFMLFFLLSLNAYRIFAETARATESPELARLGELAQAGFIGHFIAAMFLSQAYSVYWAFYIVLSAVLNRIRTKAAEATHAPEAGAVLNRVAEA